MHDHAPLLPDPASTAAPPIATRPRSLLRSRDFLLLWSGQAVSTFGTSVSQLAMPLLVLALTRSPEQAGFVGALQLAPYLVLALPAGALVDRWNRKAVMIRCDVLRWLALGSVPLAYALGMLSVPQLYLVALVEGMANVFFSLAQVAALPQVAEPDQLPRAWALNETAESAARLAGPGLAGYLISLARTTVAGAVIAYLADSLSYLASVISLRFIRIAFQTEREVSDEGQPSVRAAIAEGLRFLWRHHRLRLLALVTMAINFAQAPLGLAIIVLGQRDLHIDVRTLGLIFSAGGAAGLLASLAAPWAYSRLRFGTIIVGGAALWAISIVLLAVAPGAGLLALGRAGVDLMWPLYAVAVVTYRLSLVPDHLQGRINSSFRMLTYGAEPLGSAVGGLLLASLGPRPVLWLAAAVMAACALLAAGSDLRKV